MSFQDFIDSMQKTSIYGYFGEPKRIFENVRFLAYCNMIQDMINTNSEFFEDFDNDTIYVIDVATKTFQKALINEINN